MSPSPATPEQVNMHVSEPSSKSIVNCAEKSTSASKFKQACLDEPSPASTYGETNVGSSTPATPLEVGGHGKPLFSPTDSAKQAEFSHAFFFQQYLPYP